MRKHSPNQPRSGPVRFCHLAFLKFDIFPVLPEGARRALLGRMYGKIVQSNNKIALTVVMLSVKFPSHLRKCQKIGRLMVVIRTKCSAPVAKDALKFQGINESVPQAEDSAEMLLPYDAAEALDGSLAGHTLMIEYEDGEGRQSRRRITIRQFVGGTPGRIDAICLERQAVRTFRLDRIKSIIDRYGEVFEPASKYFESKLGIKAPDLFAPSKSEAYRLKIMSVVGPGLHLLTAIAAADRFLHAEEQEAIMRYCDVCCLKAGLNLTPSWVSMLEQHIQRSLALDNEMLVKAVKALAASNYKKQFDHAAREVIEADGVQDLAESRIYMEISAALEFEMKKRI